MNDKLGLSIISFLVIGTVSGVYIFSGQISKKLETKDLNSASQSVSSGAVVNHLGNSKSVSALETVANRSFESNTSEDISIRGSSLFRNQNHSSAFIPSNSKQKLIDSPTGYDIELHGIKNPKTQFNSSNIDINAGDETAPANTTNIKTSDNTEIVIRRGGSFAEGNASQSNNIETVSKKVSAIDENYNYKDNYKNLDQYGVDKTTDPCRMVYGMNEYTQLRLKMMGCRIE